MLEMNNERRPAMNTIIHVNRSKKTSCFKCSHYDIPHAFCRSLNCKIVNTSAGRCKSFKDKKYWKKRKGKAKKSTNWKGGKKIG